MKKTKITIIYNSFFNAKKVFDQINLLKTACKELKVEAQFINNEELISNIDLKNKNKLNKKILFLDKNIALAKILENWGYKLYNNSNAINLCDNKAYTHIALLKEKIIQPKTFVGPITFGLKKISLKSNFIKSAKKELKYPFILKEVYGSFGNQVYLIRNDLELEKKLKETKDKQIIIQKFLKKYSGTSIRVIFINKNIVGAICQTNINDFRSNLTLGSESKVIEVTKLMKSITNKIIKSLGLFYGGIDFLIDENKKLLFCEANSNVQLVNASKILKKNLAKILVQEIINN